jgi:outer membrane biogenesis lipoprotein LolB
MSFKRTKLLNCLLCCGCVEKEEENKNNQQETELQQVRKQELENNKRYRNMGLKTSDPRETASNFAKKIHESRSPKIGKKITNNIDDWMLY